MARLWRFRIALLFVLMGTTAPVWGETIEFVTYYPSPTAQGTSNMQSAAIGTGYNGVTPDDGELLVFESVGIGPGFDTQAPAGRLHVQGSANATTNAIFMPGAGGDMRLGIGTATPLGRLHVNLEPLDVGSARFYTPTLPTGTGNAANNFNQIRLGYGEGGFQSAVIRFNRDDNSGNLLQLFHWGESTGLVIRRGGNVGIGTTAPASRLTIRQGSDSQSVGTAGLRLINTAGTAVTQVLTGADNGSYFFNGTGGNYLMLSAAGKVGINTTNPGQRLHVYEPTANVWTANIQGNTHGLYASGSTHGLYGYATGGGWPVYGYNGSYGNYAGLAYSNVGIYAYTPQANWASIASGSYYGSYGYGRYYGGYFQNGNYWSPGLFAYNGGSGYWSYIAYGYFGLYTNGYIYGYWASSKDYKKNIVPLSSREEASILSQIERLPLVHYLYKMDKDEHTPRLGVTAESLPKEVKSEDGKGLEPSAYVAYSIAGVKALSAQVKKQQETIESQQEELRELKRQVQQLQEKNTL